MTGAIATTLLVAGISTFIEINKNNIAEGHKLAKISNRWYDFRKKQNISYCMKQAFLKEYGFDAIISLPCDTNLINLRRLIPQISSLYNSDVIIEPSREGNTSAYMRCHLNDFPISPKNIIRFKWYQNFCDGTKVRNNLGETFSITKISEIYNPNKLKDIKKKDDEQEYIKNRIESIVGYTLEISIPSGLNYDDLKKYETNLNNILGKCTIDWDSKKLKAIVTIVTIPLSNDEKFTIIKCKPWELYVAMGYDYSPIICDFKANGNLMLGGKNNTGKTRAEIQAMVNLCKQYDDSKIQLFIGYTTYKTDLRIFKDLKQTKTYMTSLDDLLKLFKFLNKQAEYRNKIFTECDGFITNIYEYNEYAKKHHMKEMPIMYFITDEITDFMENNNDEKNIKDKKKQCNSLFWSIARLGRSAGIYELMSAQRMSKENVNAETKAQMGTKICFYQPNTASALTVFGLGDDCAAKITRLEKQRECLIDNQDGIKIGKTLFLSNEMMLDLLKDSIVKDKKYLNLDVNGNIIKEITEIINKNDEKVSKIPRFKQNLLKKQQKTDKDTKKVVNFDN